jgi:hypothetical protein
MASQLYGTNSLGGFLSAPELSQRLRVAAQPLKRFRAFTSPLGAGGAHRNANVFFDKIGNVAAAGGSLVETNTIAETTVGIQQGTATMLEYGNAIAYSGKLISLSQLSPEDAVAIALATMPRRPWTLPLARNSPPLKSRPCNRLRATWYSPPTARPPPRQP